MAGVSKNRTAEKDPPPRTVSFQDSLYPAPQSGVRGSGWRPGSGGKPGGRLLVWRRAPGEVLHRRAVQQEQPPRFSPKLRAYLNLVTPLCGVTLVVPALRAWMIMCQAAQRIPFIHNAPQVFCPKIQPYLVVSYEVWYHDWYIVLSCLRPPNELD